MGTHDDLTAARRQKLEALKAQGLAPYGGKFPKAAPIQVLLEQYREGKTVTTAGRLRTMRGHGGITFADLTDSSGKLQLCFRENTLGKTTYQQFFDMIDLGDCLGIEGTLFQTKTKEITVEVKRCVLLAKALRPMPEKWHGLRDVEIRYRKRYLDLIANAPVRRVFEGRARLLESLRATLMRQGYLEVEPPMMHPIPGGAAGEPFLTHHEALDTDFYLRLAPELYLKRLLVGGFEKVFELNRCFRNEGLSRRHNPEFTMLEAYCAYEDYTYMMRLVQELIVEAAKATTRTLQFEYQGRQVDLSKEWEVVSFTELLKTGYGLGPEDGFEAMREKLQKPKRGYPSVDIKGQTRSQVLRLIEQLIEPKAKAVPVFITDYWTEMSPLAKSRADNPAVVERFELFIGGLEVANAYSELNDPIEQRRRFEAQLGGPRGTARARQIDEEFVEALEYGMPPATGLGVGVDRLTMVLFDQPSIKDVILFPLLKPSSD